MAKGSIVSRGMTEALAELEFFSENLEEACKDALEDALPDIESAMKTSAAATFTKGYAKGVMVNSISYNVSVVDGGVVASVGVYDMSRKTGSEDRKVSGRRISAPMLAYWYETGIRPHSTAYGARLAHPSRRGKEKGQTGKLHRGSPQLPFLSSVFDTSGDQVLTSIKFELGKLLG